jgi:hypothetical protein
LNCPALISNQDYLRCSITFLSGTNLKASITYGDGSSDIFNSIGYIIILLFFHVFNILIYNQKINFNSIQDFEPISYGGPVPKTINNLVASNLSLSTMYLATNTEILVDGYLKALEVYAETAGFVQISVQLKFYYIKFDKNLKSKIK